MAIDQNRVSTLAAAMGRYFTPAQIEAAERKALDAALANSTEVTITATGFEGGTASGEWKFDPHEVLAACEMVRVNAAALENPYDPTTQKSDAVSINFSRRRFST